MRKAADTRVNAVGSKLEAAQRQITELQAAVARNSKKRVEETSKAMDQFSITRI